MKLFMLDSDTHYIDLDIPVIYERFMDSRYPFGFIVYNTSANVERRAPDRCEYLLTQVEHPELLQTLLDIMPEIHPELYI